MKTHLLITKFILNSRCLEADEMSGNDEDEVTFRRLRFSRVSVTQC